MLDIWQSYKIERGIQSKENSCLGKVVGTLPIDDEKSRNIDEKCEKWTREIRWFDEPEEEWIEKWKITPRLMAPKKGELQKFIATQKKIRLDKKDRITEKKEIIRTINDIKSNLPNIFKFYRIWLNKPENHQEDALTGLANDTRDVEILMKGSKLKWMPLIKRRIIQEFWRSGGAKEDLKKENDDWNRSCPIASGNFRVPTSIPVFCMWFFSVLPM